MGKILTVIIPSYNMEAYLPQCLNSLLVENLKDTEVIIVNDGSKDKTIEIAQNYQKQFPESIHVIDKSNGNYGSCINAAIKVATGKYVKVLDADDSFDQNNFNLFINFLKTVDSDLVISNFIMVNEKGETIKEITILDELTSGKLSFKQCVDELVKEKFQMHAVTYRRSILQKIKYHQQEGISYTDQQWMFEPMNEVTSISVFPKIVYKYLVGREGQTVDPRISFRNLDQTIQVVTTLLQKYNQLNGGCDIVHKSYLKARLLQKIPTLYRIGLLKTDNPELRLSLSKFDETFRILNSEMYKETEIDRFGPIYLPYVRYWRKQTQKGANAPLLKPLRYIVIKFF